MHVIPFRQDLLALFLQDSSVRCSVRIGAFILLASPHLAALTFGHFVEDFYPCLSLLLAVCAPGLQQLSTRYQEKLGKYYLNT